MAKRQGGRQAKRARSPTPPRPDSSPACPALPLDLQSPVPTSRARAMTLASNPDSPFSGFASKLPALNSLSCEKERAHFPPPGAGTSLFSAFSSTLANLNASPSSMTPAPASTSWFNNEMGSGTKSMLLSPSGWQPLSSSKARRTLIGADELSQQLGEGGAAASGGSLNKTPQTPRMQLITFGESSLSEMLSLVPGTPPVTVGAFGSFNNRLSASRGSSTCSSESGSAKKDPMAGLTASLDEEETGGRSKRAHTRRKLETKLEMTPSSSSNTTQEWGRGMRQRSSRAASLIFEQDEAMRDLEDSDEGEVEDRRLSMLSSKATPPQPPKSARPLPQRDASRLCKCKKSKCIRQYCICFRAGDLCQGCDCIDCLNDGDHEEERLASIEHIKTSDPLAFETKVYNGDAMSVPTPKIVTGVVTVAGGKGTGVAVVHHVRGCKCRNSRCQKKYCECFEYGVSCSAKCGCRDCANGKPPSDDAKEGGSERLKRKAAVFEGRSERQRAMALAAESKGDTNSENLAPAQKAGAVAPETPKRRAAPSSAPFTPLPGDQGAATSNLNTTWESPSRLDMSSKEACSIANTLLSLSSPVRTPNFRKPGSPLAHKVPAA